MVKNKPARFCFFDFIPEQLALLPRVINNPMVLTGISHLAPPRPNCTEFLPPIQTRADILAKTPAFERQIRTRFACQSAASGVCRLHGAAPTSPWTGIVMLFALSRYSSALQQPRRYTKPLNPLNDCRKQLTRHSHLRHLKSHVLGMPDHLGSDLDQFLP